MNKRVYILSVILILLVAGGVLFLVQRGDEISRQSAQLQGAIAASSTPPRPRASGAGIPPPQAQDLPAASSAPVPAVVSAPTGLKTSYRIPVLANETVLEAMQAYASSTPSFAYGGHTVAGLGFFVDSIDGRTNGSGSYWFLYINGSSSQLGASSAKVAPDDVVEWRYEGAH